MAADMNYKSRHLTMVFTIPALIDTSANLVDEFQHCDLNGGLFSQDFTF